MESITHLIFMKCYGFPRRCAHVCKCAHSCKKETFRLSAYDHFCRCCHLMYYRSAIFTSVLSAIETFKDSLKQCIFPYLINQNFAYYLANTSAGIQYERESILNNNKHIDQKISKFLPCSVIKILLYGFSIRCYLKSFGYCPKRCLYLYKNHL